MPTNSIGRKNRIVQACVHEDEATTLGRLAYQLGERSVSALVATLIRREISAARAKGIIADAAQRSLKLSACVIFGLGLGLTAFAAIAGNNEPRTARRVRRKDDAVEIIQEA